MLVCFSVVRLTSYATSDYVSILCVCVVVVGVSMVVLCLIPTDHIRRVLVGLAKGGVFSGQRGAAKALS